MTKPYKVAVPAEVPIGISEMRTRIGIHVINVHYTADPAKRNANWVAAAKTGLTKRDWQREYEIDWSIATGVPVFPDFDKAKHRSRSPIRALSDVPMYVGLDFGLNPAAAFLQVSPLGQVRVIRALNEENCPQVVFIPKHLYAMMLKLDEEMGIERDLVVTQELRDRYAERAEYAAYFIDARKEYTFIGDPAGRNRNETEGRSAYDYYADFGIQVKPGKQAWNTRLNAVTQRIIAGDIAPGVPAFIVSNDSSCDRLGAGFEGSYAYAENRTSEIPVKDKFSHPQDAVQYPMTFLFPVTNKQAKAEGIQRQIGDAPTPTVRHESGPKVPDVERPTVQQLPTHMSHQFDGEWNPALQSVYGS